MKPNEFYTPSRIIEIARACMGGIDLDPASCAVANETVKATTFYDLKQNGLKRPWFGKVWLNPPFGKFGPVFVKKAIEEFKAGRIEQALILLKATHPATRWFNDAVTIEHFICLPRKRINFSSSAFVVSAATFPSVLIGIGIERHRFESCFGQLGNCLCSGGRVMKTVDEILAQSDRLVGGESLAEKFFLPFEEFMALSADDELTRNRDRVGGPKDPSKLMS